MGKAKDDITSLNLAEVKAILSGKTIARACNRHTTTEVTRNNTALFEIHRCGFETCHSGRNDHKL